MNHRFNEFLKGVPDKWLLFLLFLCVFAAYLWLRLDFLGQLAQTIVGAILGIIGVRRLQNVDASTESGDVIVPPADQNSDQTKEKG